MSKNITYLLGAGASFNALPIVEGIPDALEKFAQNFSPPNINESNLKQVLENIDICSYKFLNNIKNDGVSFNKYYKLLQQFHKDILWLQKESKNHSSIDTFAKKLYLQKNYSDLKRLKIILSCFFTYLQTKKFDSRYDNFFASILEDIKSLPKNLKILSWNYDSQLEIAYKNFSNLPINISKNTLNIYSKGSKNNSITENSFSVFKINGTTNLINTVSGGDGEYEIIEDFDIDEINLTREFLELYESWVLRSESNMSFAWEEKESEKDFFNDLKNVVSQTEILIVIGYSFPFFNRRIDKLILDSMPKLEKVYVQDPKNAEDIIEKIKGLIPDKKRSDGNYLEPIEYKAKTFKDQFFIPIEF